MANLLKLLGPATSLLALAALLAALLAASAHSDYGRVTTAECQARGRSERVRRYPTDSDAIYLAMSSCDLTEINQAYQDTFTALPNLKIIDLNLNHIGIINPAAFHTVPTLTSLWLSWNKLSELPVFDERSCSNLTELSLYSNRLTGIENERTFAACVKLENLDLSLNNVEFIHPDTFRPLIELKRLFLKYNKLRFIQDQMFASNGRLQQLQLNHNRITHLPPDFASNLKRVAAGLVVFYFHDNPWHCACLLELVADEQRAGPACALLLAALMLGLATLPTAGARPDEWVTTADCKARGRMHRVRRYPTDSAAINLVMYFCGLTEINEAYQDVFTGLPNLKMIELSSNQIGTINPAAFHTVPTLTTLRLPRNKLRELPVFDDRSCPNLTELYLYRNQLTGIKNESTFSACVKLEILELQYNDIEFIHPDSFRPLINLRYLLLQSNKIGSIPDQMFANNGKLELLYLNNNRITHLPPDFASSLKRTAAGLKGFLFYRNPWHCACLFELLADVRKVGVSYSSSSYDGTEPECVCTSTLPGTSATILGTCPRFS